MTALYTLAGQYADLTALADDDPEANLEELLDLVHGEIQHKAESIISVVRNLEALSEARVEEARRLKARAVAAENAALRLRKYLLDQMKVADVRRLEGTRFTISIARSRPSVHVLDAGAVASEFQRTKVEISVNKDAIIEHYKATGEIPAGVEIAHGEHITVR